MNTSRHPNLLLFLFAIVIAIVCHILFSPYGFNPTDEGFVLSSSVRLLHGQIPHVDFSSLRPLGYAYLHIPELLISKDYTFLISRFVFWFEMSLIAYLWVLILQQSFSIFNFPLSIVLFLITFIFNCHYFPIGVLHTIDGLLFALLGFFILYRFEKMQWLAGLFIGYAVLCKQGFVVLTPLLLFLFPQKKYSFLFSLIPGIFYVALISFFGGWHDLIAQLTAHSEIVEVGLLNYILNPYLYAGIVLSILYKKFNFPLTVMPLLMVGCLLLLLVTDHYHGKVLLFLFGYMITDFFLTVQTRKIYLLALALAWCVSISVGYASIALFSGGLISLLLCLELKNENHFLNDRTILLLPIVCISFFYFVRSTNIYREIERPELTFKLNGIVQGANGIYTNKKTFAVLKDMHDLQTIYPRLLALPDFTSAQLFCYNRPVLTEWPNRAEIPNDKILDKVTSILKTDSTTTIAVAKYQTALLSDTLQSSNFDDYKIIQFVKQHYRKSGETEYFELFRRTK